MSQQRVFIRDEGVMNVVKNASKCIAQVEV